MLENHPSSLCETADRSAYVVLRYSVLAEQCLQNYGISISGATIQKYVLFGVPIMDRAKQLAASVVVTSAMIELTRQLNDNAITNFKNIELSDLLPGATKFVHENEAELLKLKNEGVSNENPNT